MFFEIPLDQGLSGVFTDARSGERTPTGAVRRGLRPSPHRPRGGSGVGTRTVFTATSNRVGGLLREDGNDDESASATGDRGERRVRPGRRRLRVASETETCWCVRRARGNPSSTNATARQPGTLGALGHRVINRLRAADGTSPPGALRCTCGWGAGNGVVVKEPKELGPPQLDSARSVPIGARTEGSGNRVSVKRCQRIRDRATGVVSDTRHRPPRRKARRAM